MQKILTDYVKILPYTQEGRSLNDGQLTIYLDQLKNHISNSKNILHSKSPTFKSNIIYLEDNISYIKKGIKNKHFDYSRIQIKKLVSNCISCHSQLPQKDYKKISHKYPEVIEENLKSNYEKGMFAYFIRDYNASISFLKKDLVDVEGGYKQELAVAKILKIYTMNLKNYLSAKVFIQSLKSNPQIKINKSLLTKWEVDLIQWQATKINDHTYAEIKKLINKYLSPIEDEIKLGSKFDNHINLFSLQGLISNHLVSSPKTKLKAEGLYWLGLLENSTPSLYSLGDMYLVDCIKSFPNSSFAKKCYSSYAESIKFGFTGSAGTHIPEDLKQELEKLKALTK
jgi:hypothetical protein